MAPSLPARSQKTRARRCRRAPVSARAMPLPEDVVDRVDDFAGVDLEHHRIIKKKHPAIRAISRRQIVIIGIVDPVVLFEQDRVQAKADREATIAIIPAMRRIIARQVEVIPIMLSRATPVLPVVVAPATVPGAAAAIVGALPAIAAPVAALAIIAAPVATQTVIATPVAASALLAAIGRCGCC